MKDRKLEAVANPLQRDEVLHGRGVSMVLAIRLVPLNNRNLPEARAASLSGLPPQSRQCPGTETGHECETVNPSVGNGEGGVRPRSVSGAPDRPRCRGGSCRFCPSSSQSCFSLRGRRTPRAGGGRALWTSPTLSDWANGQELSFTPTFAVFGAGNAPDILLAGDFDTGQVVCNEGGRGSPATSSRTRAARGRPLHRLRRRSGSKSAPDGRDVRRVHPEASSCFSLGPSTREPAALRQKQELSIGTSARALAKSSRCRSTRSSLSSPACCTHSTSP